MSGLLLLPQRLDLFPQTSQHATLGDVNCAWPQFDLLAGIGSRYTFDGREPERPPGAVLKFAFDTFHRQRGQSPLVLLLPRILRIAAAIGLFGKQSIRC